MELEPVIVKANPLFRQKASHWTTRKLWKSTAASD